MDKSKKHSPLGKSKYLPRTLGILFVVITLLTTLACFFYYQHVRTTVEAETSGYLVEISKQMSSNANGAISNSFASLEMIAAILGVLPEESYDQLRYITQDQQDIWGYQQVLLIDRAGVAYSEEGKTIALESSAYLRDVAVKKVPSMSASQIIDGKESIIFAIPLEGVSFGGTEFAALAASFDPSTFDQILTMTAFSGQGYASIVQGDGSTVIRSSSDNAIDTGYNVLNSFSSSEILGGATWNDVKAGIATGQSGQIKFTWNSEPLYMTYTPLGTQEWSLLSFVPAQVVNAKSNSLLAMTVLICAAVTVVFALLTLFLLLTFYRSRKELERMAYVDAVTQGNTLQRFYQLVEETLDSREAVRSAVVYVNVEKFRLLNERFGEKTGDEILRSMDKGISSELGDNEYSGRISADNFCIFAHFEDEAAMVRSFEGWYESCMRNMRQVGLSGVSVVFEFGYFVVEPGSDLSVAQMVDRAKLPLENISNISVVFGEKIHYAVYDEQIHQQLLRKKHLEDIMEKALENEEFQVYLQPKYETQTERIGGAEALVRWINPTEGKIFPDEFIALFEKNGFIIPLDFWVFEVTCRTLRSWIDKGWKPIRISVNCSRVHLKEQDFHLKYCDIADAYGVPREYLELELTENVVFDNVELFNKVIKDIRNAGFSCSMDDFGSGYSSLNLIKDIPVDVLKLDKVFFSNGESGDDRTELVVQSIINMSKSLNMSTVAEGVEDRIYVDMLKRLGCDYIQGYYFARPMTIADFEKLAFPQQESDEKDKA